MKKWIKHAIKFEQEMNHSSIIERWLVHKLPVSVISSIQLQNRKGFALLKIVDCATMANTKHTAVTLCSKFYVNLIKMNFLYFLFDFFSFKRFLFCNIGLSLMLMPVCYEIIIIFESSLCKKVTLYVQLFNSAIKYKIFSASS